MSDKLPAAAKLSAADLASSVNMGNTVSTALLSDQLHFIQISPDFRQMIGAVNDPLLGAQLTDVLWEFVGVEDHIQSILEGRSDRFIFENINRQMPDGTYRYLSFQIMNGMENSGGGSLLLIVEDRSDVNRLQQILIQDRNELRLARRKLTELNDELAQINRWKSLFLSMAAHDLRTPLSSIQGYTELLREELAHEKRDQDQFDVILSQTYRLQQLINDLLDLDQIERGDIQIFFRDCQLDEIIGEIVEAMRPLSQRAGVTIEVCSPKHPFIISADPRRLSQILYNLVGNAIKFTPANGSVLINAQEKLDEVIIHVSDDGPGISSAVADDLFKPYFPEKKRDEQSTRSGTGLGLYIVKLLTVAHQGQVTVESEVGKGTTFTIVLPKSPANGEQ